MALPPLSPLIFNELPPLSPLPPPTVVNTLLPLNPVTPINTLPPLSPLNPIGVSSGLPPLSPLNPIGLSNGLPPLSPLNPIGLSNGLPPLSPLPALSGLPPLTNSPFRSALPVGPLGALPPLTGAPIGLAPLGPSIIVAGLVLDAPILQSSLLTPVTVESIAPISAFDLKDNSGIGPLVLAPGAARGKLSYTSGLISSEEANRDSKILRANASQKALAKKNETVDEIKSLPYTPLEKENAYQNREQLFAQLPLYKISNIRITAYSFEEMIKVAVVNIRNADLTGSFSVTDERMGPTSIKSQCLHCRQIDCAGHYGIIRFDQFKSATFEGMIPSPVMIEAMIRVLDCVCHYCSGLLAPEAVIKEKGLMKGPFNKRLTKLSTYCKAVPCTRHPQTCIVEGYGVVENCGANPKFSPIIEIKESGKITYVKRRAEKGKYLKATPGVEKVQLMTTQRAFEILNNISDEDSRLMGIDPSDNHPRNYIWRSMLVTPNIVRPKVYEGDRLSEDKITLKIREMMTLLMPPKNEGNRAPNPDAEEKKTTVYGIAHQIIYPAKGIAGSKPKGFGRLVSALERLQGKKGAIRQNLQAKRGNYAGRAVATPGSGLEHGEVGVPRPWGRVLTTSMWVNKLNRRVIQRLLDEKKVISIVRAATSLTITNLSNKSNHQLSDGDRVEVEMTEGEFVMFGRQPTLSAQSLMAATVKFIDQPTIQIHLSYTSPLNADFDGDELSIYKPRSYQAQLEAEYLMNVKQNIVTVSKSINIMGLVMNSVSGIYLMTEPDLRIPDNLFVALLLLIKNQVSATFNRRLIQYGVHPRSGRAIISALFPETFYYNNKGILIIEGILVRGNLSKKVVGNTGRSIIQELYNDFSPERSSNFLTSAPFVIGKWLIEHGFSVSLKDVVQYDYRANLNLTAVLVRDTTNNYLTQPVDGIYADWTVPAGMAVVMPDGIVITNVNPSQRVDKIDGLSVKLLLNGPKIPMTTAAGVPGHGATIDMANLQASIRGVDTSVTRLIAVFAGNQYLIDNQIIKPIYQLTEIDVYKEFRETKAQEIRDDLAALGPPRADPIEEAHRLKKVDERVNLAPILGEELMNTKFPKDSPMLTMSTLRAGAKGEPANIATIVIFPGQQNVAGAPPIQELTEGTRTLPMFPPGDHNPEYNGFITQPLITGLSPENLFMLFLGAREGISDTSVKTRETGRTQRDLVKSGEDAVMQHDGSLRDPVGLLYAPTLNAGYNQKAEMIVLDEDGNQYFSFIDLDKEVDKINLARGWIRRHDLVEIEANRSKVVTEINANPTAFSWRSTYSDSPLNKPPIEPAVSPATDLGLHEGPFPAPDSKIRPYEMIKLLGLRAEQISRGAPPVNDNFGREYRPIPIAKMEYFSGQLPLSVTRVMPGGAQVIISPTLEAVSAW